MSATARCRVVPSSAGARYSDRTAASADHTASCEFEAIHSTLPEWSVSRVAARPRKKAPNTSSTRSATAPAATRRQRPSSCTRLSFARLGAESGIRARVQVRADCARFPAIRPLDNRPRARVRRFPPMRFSSLTLLFALAAPLAAQGRSPADSARADSAQVLSAQRVTVTRGDATLDRVPWAVGTQRSEQIRRAQATVGIDEALANIPGVGVANSYNFALDQRVSIRGAGSRANFGLRGVKVLLDGIPQSLPDGQSQLTNVDLAA